jgi:ABC-2 type transport system ATP-binding protein
MEGSMLKVKQLSKTYQNKKGIFNINFECYPSEVMGIIGDNGSGKSTLLKSLAGINGVDKGLIELNNKSISLSQLGFLPEHKAIIEDLSAFEFIELIAKMKKIDESQWMNTCTQYVDWLDASENLSQKIKILSKGNKQKIQLIASCIHEPDIVLLDEPFSGLDEYNRKHVKNFILELKNKNKIVILTTHKVDDLEDVCDTLAWIKEGKLSEKQSVHSLKEQSSTIFVKVSFDPYQKYKDEKGVIDVHKEGHVSIYCFDQNQLAHQFLKMILKFRDYQTISIHNQVVSP